MVIILATQTMHLFLEGIHRFFFSTFSASWAIKRSFWVTSTGRRVVVQVLPGFLDHSPLQVGIVGTSDTCELLLLGRSFWDNGLTMHSALLIFFNLSHQSLVRHPHRLSFCKPQHWISDRSPFSVGRASLLCTPRAIQVVQIFPCCEVVAIIQTSGCCY